MKTYRAELLMLPGLYTHWSNPQPLGLWPPAWAKNRENPKKIKKYFTLETLPASQPSSQQQLADIIHWLTLCWERAQVLLSVHGRLFARLLFSVFGYRETRL
jgi:hypothetical protein